MNIERAKLLTEAMDECWHEWVKTRETSRLYLCLKCNDSTYKKFQTNNFSTPDGFFKLWNWSQRQEWWYREFTNNGVGYSSINTNLIHPDRFADAVYEYLKGK